MKTLTVKKTVPNKPSGGRCAGCGKTGPVKTVARHTMTCQDFQTLYSTDPARALDPAAEHARHQAHVASAEGQQAKADKIEARRMELVETSMAKYEAVRGRWTGEYFAPSPGTPVAAPVTGVYGDATDPDTAAAKVLKAVYLTGSAPE